MSKNIPRIIIIDENHINRGMVALCLHSIGCEIIGYAVDGEEGIDLFKKKKPEVVLINENICGNDFSDITGQILSASPDTMILLLNNDENTFSDNELCEFGIRGSVYKKNFMSMGDELKSYIKSHSI